MRQQIVLQTLRKLPFTHRSTTANRLQALAKIDLANVRRKLMEPAPEGKGWTEEQALGAEKWYRRFLHIIIAHPDGQHVPNYTIDTFWHQHILDTRAYAKDCNDVFGHFLHHYPYFGLNGDAKERDDCFVQTNELYMKEFGEDCTGKVKSNSECMSACGGNELKAEQCSVEHCYALPELPKLRAGKIKGTTECMSACSDSPTIKASGCAAPCVPEACSGGGTCASCTVDGFRKEPVSTLSAKPFLERELMANSCGHGGSGTGCGQGCSRGK